MGTFSFYSNLTENRFNEDDAAVTADFGKLGEIFLGRRNESTLANMGIHFTESRPGRNFDLIFRPAFSG